MIPRVNAKQRTVSIKVLVSASHVCIQGILTDPGEDPATDHNRVDKLSALRFRTFDCIQKHAIEKYGFAH